MGLCFVSNGGFVDGSEYLTRPHREISDEASRINGFNQDEIDLHPEFSKQWPGICDWLEGNLIVAHNAERAWKPGSS